MNNLVELSTFKNIKLVAAQANSSSRYYSLLGTNELLAEATLMISQILDDKITDDLLKESKLLVREMKLRAQTRGNVVFEALTQVSNSLNQNVDRYLSL